MWFMNRIANPLVRLLLRSPLHGLMSASVLLITYRGRKTGKAHTLPTQYARDGSQVYIVVGMPEQKTWWRNLRGGQAVSLTLAGKVVPGQAVIVDGSSDRELAARALACYVSRFPSAARLRNIRREPDGSLNRDDLRQAAGSLIAVQVDLENC